MINFNKIKLFRIKILRRKMINISTCNLCGKLPNLECNTIKKGSSKILILGESPAKDGWIVSGKAFYNKEGKLQATGKVLQKLLDLCGVNIDDINFTECCKCVISDRSKLRYCMNNCKPILISQMKLFDCDVVLPMGKYASEVVLNKKIEKFKDYVGKTFLIDFGNGAKKVIPIYHTSPANPLCFKGNEEIFKNLKFYLNQN